MGKLVAKKSRVPTRAGARSAARRTTVTNGLGRLVGAAAGPFPKRTPKPTNLPQDLFVPGISRPLSAHTKLPTSRASNKALLRSKSLHRVAVRSALAGDWSRALQLVHSGAA